MAQAVQTGSGPQQIPDETREQLLRTWPRPSKGGVVAIVVLVLAVLWGMDGTNASPRTLIGGLPNLWDFAVRMFPPSFETRVETLQTPAIGYGDFVLVPRLGFESITYPMPEIIYYVIETLQMAIVGTIGAILLSIPFGVMAARNLAPHPIIYQTARMLLNANRAVPDLIIALIFVGAVGLGPFGGVMALAVGSVGFMGKMYAESIEAIDPEQVKAIRATGASRTQTVLYSVFPQAMPMITSYSLLVFESNVRSATILGLVGAGGVGFVITKYMNLFQYDKLLGALIIIIIMVTIVDRFSDALRRRLI